MAKKSKFYTVWNGYNPGVYSTWESCKQQVDGFEGARYKAFDSREAAETALSGNYWNYVNRQSEEKPVATSASAQSGTIIAEALAVDAACSGNPGDMEYRGVYVASGKQVFIRGPYKCGTNNVGEFLAIVHGLALLKKLNLAIPIYSDSVIAQGWVRKKKCNTKLLRTRENEPLFDMVAKAEKWLEQNSYTTKILKWDTDQWGEIPADFGRK